MAIIFKDLASKVYKKTLKFVKKVNTVLYPQYKKVLNFAACSKNLGLKLFNKAYNYAKNNKLMVKYTAIASAAVLTLVICIVSSGLTVGYNVEYMGQKIAVVKEKSVFDIAKTKVVENLLDGNNAEELSPAKYALALTFKDNFTTADELVDVIIKNTDSITTTSALKVNGEIVAYSSDKILNKLLTGALRKYYVKDAKNTSTFVDEVEICEGYCFKSQIKPTAEVKKLVGGLKVKTVATVTTKKSLDYTTKVVYTAEKVRGYESVKTEGQKGVESKVTVLEKLNGKKTAKTVVSKKVIKEPVEEVIVKGTAVNTAAATARAEAKSAGFICPLNSGTIKSISAYWGDGRNHKAIDMRANVGVPIFAAKAGKVVSAGWDGNYGYAVVVDHGNGYKTRYAHANALCVKSGATVSQGQQIATVGNTGRSTGPHLHFEVIKNGVRVNPAPYIGY